MKHFWSLIIGIIIGLSISYLLDRGQNKENPDEAIVRIDTLVITDSVDKPIPYPVEVIKQLPPVDTDTASVISDYFSKRVYNDTLINTEMLMVTVIDTVNKNSLLARKIYYNYSYPQITKSVKDRVFLNADSRGITSVSWMHKNISVSAGYDVVNKKPILGFGVKLFER